MNIRTRDAIVTFSDLSHDVHLPVPVERRITQYLRAGTIYAVGGSGLDSVERYAVTTDTWSLMAPMAHKRRGHGVVFLGGFLFAVGGTPDHEGPLDFGSVERYSVSTNTWSHNSVMTTKRYVHAVAVLRGVMYAVGGYNLRGKTLSSVERFDPTMDLWALVAPMHVARRHFGVAVLNEFMYAVGGYVEVPPPRSHHSGPVNSVERYDASLDAWTPVAPMLKARNGHSVASSGDYVYVAGGARHQDMERYDPTTDSWSLISTSLCGMECGLVALGGFLYVVGGLAAPQGLQRYDTTTGSWTVMASMSFPRTCHGLAAE